MSFFVFLSYEMRVSMMSSMRFTCTVDLKSWNSSLRNFVHPPTTSMEMLEARR